MINVTDASFGVHPQMSASENNPCQKSVQISRVAVKCMQCGTV